MAALFADVVGYLLLFLMIVGVCALLDPSFGRMTTRKQVLKVYGSSCFVLFVLLAFLVPPEKENGQSSTKEIQNTVKQPPKDENEDGFWTSLLMSAEQGLSDIEYDDLEPITDAEESAAVQRMMERVGYLYTEMASAFETFENDDVVLAKGILVVTIAEAENDIEVAERDLAKMRLRYGSKAHDKDFHTLLIALRHYPQIASISSRYFESKDEKLREDVHALFQVYVKPTGPIFEKHNF